MADKKIKDSDLRSDLSSSRSYSIKSLWGVPKTFLKILKALNKANKNLDLGYELPAEDFENADTEEEENLSVMGN